MIRFGLPAAFCAALCLTATASAKQTQVTVTGPTSAHAGVPFTLTLHVAVDGKPYGKAGYRPTVYLMGKGELPVATFHGTPVAPGTFRVRVVFPHTGSWSYVVPDPLNGDWTFVAPHVAP